MARAATHVRLTYQDYLAIPEDGRRHEIIDGEHAMTPSPATRHQVVSGRLFWLVFAFLRERPLGQVFTAPLDVLLSDHDVLQPDLVYVSLARHQVVTERNLRGAPDLVVEILSDTTRRRDELDKRRTYARSGVPEYWLVDPDLETVRVLRLEGSAYREVVFLARDAGEVLTSTLFPGLEIPLTELFG